MERRALFPPTSAAKFFILAAIYLSTITVTAVVILNVALPNNTTAPTSIVTFTTPLIMGLMAAGLHGMLTVVDGKMSRLLEATADKEHLAGYVDGLKENPKIPIS